ncbi:hypothetical protein [Marinomonas spartinae]|nr:hypothetical protein [Marinomonas spartinae]
MTTPTTLWKPIITNESLVWAFATEIVLGIFGGPYQTFIKLTAD